MKAEELADKYPIHILEMVIKLKEESTCFHYGKKAFLHDYELEQD
tara:strand:+ start:764 stop:898 length:135 start_codon:yes stop_codon:yes gene_type:complete